MDVFCLSPFISPLLYNVRARRELSSPSSPIPSFTDEDNEAERRSVISSRAHSQLEAAEGENAIQCLPSLMAYSLDKGLPGPQRESMCIAPSLY